MKYHQTVIEFLIFLLLLKNLSGLAFKEPETPSYAVSVSSKNSKRSPLSLFLVRVVERITKDQRERDSERSCWCFLFFFHSLSWSSLVNPMTVVAVIGTVAAQAPKSWRQETLLSNQRRF